MSQSATHTAPSTPQWPRVARYGALLVLVLLTAIAMRSLVAKTTIPTPRPAMPQQIRQLAPTLCSEFPEAHFVLISYRATPATPSPTCGARRPVIMNA